MLGRSTSNASTATPKDSLQAAVVHKQVSVNDATILEVIRDEEGNHDEVFSEGVLPLARYPLTTGVLGTDDEVRTAERNKKYAAAHVVVEVIRKFADMPGSTEKERVSQQKTAMKEFNKHFDLHLPTPDFNLVVTPTFGPLTAFGEDVLEAFNRALQMVRNLIYSNNANRWPFTSGRRADPFQSYSIAHAAPYWMSPRSRPAPQAAVSKRLTPKAFMIKWERNKGPNASALKRRLEEKEDETDGQFAIPPSKQKVASDPRVYDDPGRWRDSVRRQYNCEKAEKQISRLQMHVTDKTDSSAEPTTYSLYGEYAEEWKDIKALLNQYNPEVLRFTVRMKPISGDEDVYESNLGPLQTDGMFTETTEGGLIMRQANLEGELITEEDAPFVDENAPNIDEDALVK